MTEYVVNKLKCIKLLCIFMLVWSAFRLPGWSQVAISIEMGNKEMTYDINTIALHNTVSGTDAWAGITTQPDGISSTNISLGSLIQNAYGLTFAGAISGLPKWADTARFDVDLKMAPIVAEAFNKLSDNDQIIQRQYMLQLILLDRFNLVVHHTTMTTLTYDLVLTNVSNPTDGEPNRFPTAGLEASTTATDPTAKVLCPGHLNGKGIRMSELAAQLSDKTKSLVVDKTALTGRYDVSLQWTPDRSLESKDSPASSRAELTIFAALQEQLGLSLRPTKQPVDAIVVDHVQMPAAD